MKLFGREIRLREKFKGFFVSSGATKRRKMYSGERSWSSRVKYYDTIVERHPLAKAQTLTIAGQLMAEGVFTEPAKRKGGEYPRSEEAQRKCDDLNDQIGLDTMLYETALRMAKYGSCFWEKTWSPKFDVRVIPMQEGIEPEEQDDEGNIVRWRQRSPYGAVIASWSNEEIIHLPWNITTKSWPYGTSLLVGLDTEFEILEQLEIDIQEYMHKNAFPTELWQVGDGQFMPTDTQVNTIKSEIRNWEPGSKHVTSYPINREAGGTGDRTIASLDAVLNFLKEQAIDGLMVPPISKQWSSTMASAKEMMPWARTNLITPMQRIIRRKIEQEVYRPYLEDLGYSVRVTPKLRFEDPSAHKEENAEYYGILVQTGIITPEVAAEELGYGDRLEEMRKQREDAEMRRVKDELSRQDQFTSKGAEDDNLQMQGKSWKVTEIHKNTHKHKGE